MNEHLPESGSSWRGSGRPGVHLSGLVRAIGLPAPDTRELDPRGQRGADAADPAWPGAGVKVETRGTRAGGGVAGGRPALRGRKGA